MLRTLLGIFVIGSAGFCAHADENMDAAILSALGDTPLVDVMECQVGDEKSRSSLLMIVQMDGGKMNKKTRKAVGEFDDRLIYWNAIVAAATEGDLLAAEADAKARSENRKKELNAMSAIEQSLYLARRDYPCDDIFEAAVKKAK